MNHGEQHQATKQEKSFQELSFTELMELDYPVGDVGDEPYKDPRTSPGRTSAGKSQQPAAPITPGPPAQNGVQGTWVIDSSDEILYNALTAFLKACDDEPNQAGKPGASFLQVDAENLRSDPQSAPASQLHLPQEHRSPNHASDNALSGFAQNSLRPGCNSPGQGDYMKGVAVVIQSPQSPLQNTTETSLQGHVPERISVQAHAFEVAREATAGEPRAEANDTANPLALDADDMTTGEFPIASPTTSSNDSNCDAKYSPGDNSKVAAALSASAKDTITTSSTNPATQEQRRVKERRGTTRDDPIELIASPPSLEADDCLSPEEIEARYKIFLGLPFIPRNYFEHPARGPEHPQHSHWASLYAAAVNHMRRSYQVQPLHLITMCKLYLARARRPQPVVAGSSSSQKEPGSQPSSCPRGDSQPSRPGRQVPSAAAEPPQPALLQRGQAPQQGHAARTGRYPILVNPCTGLAFWLNPDGTVTQMRDPSTREPLVYPVNQPYSGWVLDPVRAEAKLRSWLEPGC